MQKEFRKLVTKDEAKRIINRLGIRAGISEINIKDASGHIPSMDVFSQVDVPPFDRAAMDGFAVRASDTFRAREDMPVAFKLVGSILPGVNPDIQIEYGEAAEIATGAMMPAGADSVVMVEYTRMDKELFVLRPVSVNENVMHAGADIMAGERLLKKRTVLGPREIGLFACLQQQANSESKSSYSRHNLYRE